jgi:regulator of replication initiation timing
MKKYRYLIAFAITSALFGTAFYISSQINDARIENVAAMQENMAIDILSLETQFDLLQERSCTDIRENSVLSTELSKIQSRLGYTEAQLGSDDARVLQLKRQYSLLQIKDYLLMKRVSQKCGLRPIFLLYFYSNKDKACSECEKQGYVLTALSEKYPELRVYSFDANLDLSALQTLANLSTIDRATLPALVIQNTAYSGYKTVEEIEKLFPALEKLDPKKDEGKTDAVKKK